jgi:hypothetical protein
MADIDINLPGGTTAMLIELLKGQQASATELRLQNERLFGGNGQPGAIPVLFAAQQKLGEQLDTNKDLLIAKIDAAKEDLSSKMATQKRDVQLEIKEVRDDHETLDKRVSKLNAIGSTLYTVLILGLSAFGIWHKH